jgi:starch-binding outer membrane protein, SusD/RagB family
MENKNTHIIKGRKAAVAWTRTGMLLFLLTFVFQACDKYLDIVPDNVATIDNAFALRNEALKYLYTCYSYLPQEGHPTGNIGFLAGDEMWVPTSQRDLVSYAWQIARGNQGVSNPYFNYWDGLRGGPNERLSPDMFNALRDCNIFLENVSDLSKVSDLAIDERERWLAEVKFLKAYYHFLLLRMYGPIPIIDKNIDVAASPEEVKVKRMPVDSCVNYIANLLDEAAAKLPATIQERNLELGRITKAIALGVKAKLLVTAASPLFNGNPDYNSFKDKDGVALFNTVYNATKWQRAAEACKTAVEACETVGHKLYEFPPPLFKLTDTTMRQMSIRNAVCERWNSEQVWANSNSPTGFLQIAAMGRLYAAVSTNTNARSQLCAPLKMAELFYTKNGVPINEDKTLDFSNKYQVRTVGKEDRFNLIEGYQTARLNFDREPRFYADLCFDGGVWYMYSSPTGTDSGTYVMQAKATQYGGNNIQGFYNESGYFIKKLVDWNFTFGSSGVTVRDYAWPQIRLADLYLLYAEALNEATGPSATVYSYLNKVRERAGIPSIEDAWNNYSINPNKYTTKEGLRAIIKQERMIELAFEGHRFWDIRRWKDASATLNTAITGWTITESSTTSYYQPRVLFQQQFIAPRDYLWPIRQYNLTVNPNLVQNPGW